MCLARTFKNHPAVVASKQVQKLCLKGSPSTVFKWSHQAMSTDKWDPEGRVDGKKTEHEESQQATVTTRLNMQIQ